MTSYPQESGGPSSRPIASREPIPFSQIVEGSFYLVKLSFPLGVNEASPLRHHVTIPGVPPVFRAPHLDVPTSSGIWKSIQGPNYYRPCLVVGPGGDGSSVFLFLASTNPRFSKRWLPLEGSPFLPGQPTITVATDPPGIFSNPPNGKYGYLCYTHVFRVTPVLRNSPRLLSQQPALVHVAQLDPQRIISCPNLVAIEAAHLTYWCREPSVSNDPDNKQEGGGHGGVGGGNTDDKGGHGNQRGKEGNQGPGAGNGGAAADCEGGHGHGPDNQGEGGHGHGPGNHGEGRHGHDPGNHGEGGHGHGPGNHGEGGHGHDPGNHGEGGHGHDPDNHGEGGHGQGPDIHGEGGHGSRRGGEGNRGPGTGNKDPAADGNEPRGHGSDTRSERGHAGRRGGEGGRDSRDEGDDPGQRVGKRR